VTSIEDELRQVLADPRRAPQGWPDAVERVRAGMRRRHRRRALVATGSVTLLVVLGTALAVARVRGPAPDAPIGPSPSTGASVVPWRDLPSVHQPEPTLSPRPTAAACRTADLLLDAIDTDGAGGTTFNHVKVHNAGPARCTVSGRPTLVKTDPKTGRTSAAATGTTTMFSPQPGSTPATIDPGEQAWLDIETYGGCLDDRPEITYADVRLRLPDGGQIALRTSLNATCGVNLSVWFRSPPTGPQPDPFAALTVSIQAPASVKIGTTLDYLVTLTNPTASDIALHPCPNYSVFLQAPVKAGGYHQLNCAVPAIPAYGSVRFAMRLTIPSYTTYSGPTKLSWTLGDNGAVDQAPAANAPITIEP